MSMNKTRTRATVEDFNAAGTVRLTKEDKISLAMTLYLTLDALNESAPLGCDGLPMELLVQHGSGRISLQKLLAATLKHMKAPVPQEPEPEFQEGCCGCGNPIHPDSVN